MRAMSSQWVLLRGAETVAVTWAPVLGQMAAAPPWEQTEPSVKAASWVGTLSTGSRRMGAG